MDALLLPEVQTRNSFLCMTARVLPRRRSAASSCNVLEDIAADSSASANALKMHRAARRVDTADALKAAVMSKWRPRRPAHDGRRISRGSHGGRLRQEAGGGRRRLAPTLSGALAPPLTQLKRDHAPHAQLPAPGIA
jgi:hypothetical protein